MSLSVTVGILSDLLANDPEGADWVRKDMAAVQAAMKKAGLHPHREPENSEVWWAEGYGYSGLHALREVAGLVWLKMPIPRDSLMTGEEISNEEALFEAILPSILTDTSPGLFGRFFGQKPKRAAPPPFAHLVAHSDAQGYYVPTDFESPLAPQQMNSETAQIWPLGSVQRLQAELALLASALEIPADLGSEDDELAEYMDTGGSLSGERLWQAKPIATHSLLILREACDHSLKTGAAISFG